MNKKINNIKAKISKTKIIIISVIIIITVLIGLGIKYINDNYMGFTEVDFSDMVFIKYNKEGFDATPELDWSGNYYSSNGYYDDYRKMLETTGIYSEEQIEKLIPTLEQQVYTSISKIYTGFELSTDHPLKNGDELEITINYNEDKAKEEKIDVVNNKVSFKISGLYNSVSVDDINLKIFDQVGGVEQLKKDAINNNLGILDMTVTIPEYKLYLEAANSEGVQTNAYQKINVVYQEKDTYKYDGIEPSYFVCNRQFNVYESNGEIKLDDVNEGEMNCVDKKDIKSVMNDISLKEELGITNDVEMINN